MFFENDIIEIKDIILHQKEPFKPDEPLLEPTYKPKPMPSTANEELEKFQDEVNMALEKLQEQGKTQKQTVTALNEQVQSIKQISRITFAVSVIVGLLSIIAILTAIFS